jgi:hypothetical protein
MSCELWSLGCSEPNEPCTLDNSNKVEVLIEVVTPLDLEKLLEMLRQRDIPTPEEVGYASEDVEWTWKNGTEFPIWIVPSVEKQTKEVRGLGDE